MQDKQVNRHFIRVLVVLALVATLLFALALIFTPQLKTLVGTPAPVPGDDWPMYLHDIQRTATSAEVVLSPDNANRLTKQWAFKTNGAIAASPTIVKGTVYIGSWDGFEYALDAVTGSVKWKTYLGTTTGRCDPPKIGITSSAAVLDDVVYVGGGDSYWYALDAYTGKVQWKLYTGDNSPDKGYYNWASPLIYKGNAYIGIASNCDNPLVRGQLLKVSLATHKIVATTNFVGPNEVGGGIWTSPALDTETDTIYVTTGTQNQIWQTLPQAVVAIDLNSMQIKGSWQIPLQQSGGDYDWGNTPVLMTDTAGKKLVAATNKNGFTYAFKRDNITAGPVWEQQTGLGGQCPPCGQGSVSSGAFANGTLYMAGGNTTINGVGYSGAIRAIDPGTGKYLWEHGVPKPIIPAIAYANGLAIDAAGPTMEVLDAKTGTRLYSYQTGQDIYSPPSVSHGQIFIGSLDGNVYAFGLSTSSPSISDAQCPHGWSCQEIGVPAVNGNQTVNKNTWNISGVGIGFADVSDQFHFVSQDISGDTQITARITPQSLKNAAARAGIMTRQNREKGSPFYAALLTPQDGIVVQYRTAFNGAISSSPILNTAGHPHYIAIQRTGDRFQAAASSDGKNYTLIPGSTIMLTMPAKTLTGLAISSGTSDTLASTEFTDVTIGKTTLALAPPNSANPCPQSWQCGDIGNPQVVGDQAINNDQWQVKGEGKDIWLDGDQFRFVWQVLPDNSAVNAHVLFQTKVDDQAKAGVMLRQSTDPASPYYAALETPGHGLTIQVRNTQGLNTDIVATDATITSPHYLRIARWNNIFTTYVSDDGTTWKVLDGSSVTINIQGTMLGGMAVSSHKRGFVSEVHFDSVSTMQTADPAPTACPDRWNCIDIGYPAPPGKQLFDATTGTWTVEGGGFDIYFKTDQFHFVSQPKIGDGTVTTRTKFVNLPNIPGNDYAKAGIMLRETTDPDSPYYGVFLTPDHGIMVQYRRVAGDLTGEAVFPNPIKGAIYLRIVRAGNIFTAYFSNDGAVWQLIDGSLVDIAMANNLMAGLAVTSHDPAALKVASFDNVQL